MAIDSEIIVVSGLPRSGTSLMMQMLDRGGVPVLTDEIRTADADNPRGYFEYQPVMAIGKDASWMPLARGKSLKIVSHLLFYLPTTERYRIILMKRHLDEIVRSQNTMLKRLVRATVPNERIKKSYEAHLTVLFNWIRAKEDFQTLCVSDNDLIAHPQMHATRVSEFLDRNVNVENMTRTVHASLYRHRLRSNNRT